MSSPLQDGSIATNDVIEAVHINQLFPILADLEDGKAFFRPDQGSANAYQVDFSGTLSNKNQFSAYHQGMLVIFKAANTNTGASTLQVVGPSGNLTAVPLTKSGSVALEADDIQAGQMVAAVCNDLGGGNFRFEMVGAPAVNLTAGDIPSGVDASKIGAGSVSNAEFGYLDGVTSGLQAQIDGKAPSSHTHPASDIASGQVALARGGTGADLSATGGAGQVLKQTSAGGAVSVSALTASDMPSNIDAAKIGSGSVSNTEFGYLDGVTSGLQAQIDGKAASSHTHAASDIASGQVALARGGTGSDLSATGGAGQVLKQTSAGGAVSVSALTAGDMPSNIDAAKIGSGAVSNTEFGYLDGVTSSLQGQIDGKAASSHTHTASDIASGQVALARGGTGADLSATGGAGQVLKQSSAGGAVSVSALTASDMPNNIDAVKIGGGSVSNTEFAYLAGVTSSLQAQINGKSTIPSGLIAPYAGSSAPSGWLLCFGQNVSRTTYAGLFDAIGTAYGAGDGSTTFGLPDLRGRVTAGKDNMGGSSANRLTNSGTGNPGINGSSLGAAGGADRQTLSTAQMPSHNHTLGFYTGIYGSSSPGGGGGLSSNTLTTSSSGSGQAHPIVQPTLVTNYIIYAGV